MWKLLKKTFDSWLDNDPFSHSAAIAYYTIFSFPALLIIMMTIASIFMEKATFESNVMDYLRTMLGENTANDLHVAMENTNLSYDGIWTFVVGGTVLLYAALRLFSQLQKTLNKIWGVKLARHVSFVKKVKRRAMALGVMLTVGFILAVSLFTTVLLTALGDWLKTHIPTYLMSLFHGLNLSFSFATITLLFTAILKLLPDVDIRWKHAAFGGVMSAFLFMLGEYAMGIYFNMAEPQSAYGAVGSIILFMMWVSYSTLILLFGAEFCKACATQNHEKVVPSDIAETDKNAQSIA